MTVEARLHPVEKPAALYDVTLPAWIVEKIGPLLSRAETKESFFERIGDIWPKASEKYRLIERAYDAMERAFAKTRRDNGEQYFEHLRASALIAIVHMRVRDHRIICAILLHDAIEDLPDEWTYERIVVEFGEEIANLVWYVTKPKPRAGEDPEENDRRYHRRLRNAPREALCVKLPERLHNIITIWGQDLDRIRRKVSETRDFILPLAEENHILIHEYEDVLRAVEHKLAAA